MPRRIRRAPPRTQGSSQERDARSQAVQQVAEQALLRGSLVQMQRTCGKKHRRCQRGQKHPPLYSAIRLDNRRTMICVPPAETSPDAELLASSG